MEHKRKWLQLVMLFAVMLVGVMFIPHHPVYAAATPVQVDKVDYSNENLIVANNGNSKIYYATDTEASRDMWECIPADSGNLTTIDISWLSPTTESIIVIKGDQDATKSKVVIRKKTEKLTLTIDYSNIDNLDPDKSIASLVNIMTTEGTGEKPIEFKDLEWRKGDNGQWQNAEATLKVAPVEKFLVRGAYIYFRIVAVDDTGNGGIFDGTIGRRYSNVYKVKIPKKAAKIVTGVDGSKFTAAIPYGKEYRVTVTNSDSTRTVSKWIKITDKATRTVSLTELADSVGIEANGTTKAFPAMLVDVRSYATSKTASSKITTIDLDAQRKLNEDIQLGDPDLTQPQSNDDIYVSYFGNSYITLTIPNASVDLPYEYCFVKNGAEFDLAHASWSAVTKGTGVKILASKALQDSTIYVRQKEIKSKTATATSSAISYKLASTYQTLAISYPCVPVVKKDSLTFIKGYTNSLNIDIQLSVDGREKFEDTVSSVKLGTKEIRFTSSTVGDDLKLSLNGDDIKQMSNCLNRALTITFAKGTVDKSSVKLTIKNPTPAGSLTISASQKDAAGNIKLTMTGSAATDDTLVYVFGDALVTGKNVEDVLTGVTTHLFTSGADIAVEAGKSHITVYEINKTNNIIKYKSIPIT